MLKQERIGILDSGVGGLTVVKELQRLLPNEDIVYFGDNKNCPYGNRTQDNIVELTRDMLDFLNGQGVKLVAIACNTISTLIDRYAADYPFPIISIIQPAAEYVVQSGLEEVGVIATEFTIGSKCYDNLIHKGNDAVGVYGVASKTLAKLVDSGTFSGPVITDEVNVLVSRLLEQRPVAHAILGCTHYPIVQSEFELAAPGVTFINPALEQARAVVRLLEEGDALCETGEGSLTIYTSATPDLYDGILKRLEISGNVQIHTV